MERCIHCGHESVVQRSSYKLCHFCNAITKDSWRIRLEAALSDTLGAALIEVRRLNEFEAIVRWCRSRFDGEELVEYGTHRYSLESGTLISGNYFPTESGYEDSLDDFRRRIGKKDN